MSSEAPWGNPKDVKAYDKWRANLVHNAREWAQGDFALFLNNRLTFQRGKGGYEFEDYYPWDDPENALFDNLLVLKGEELNSWTDEEYRKVNKVMAAFLSEAFDTLVKGHEWFLVDEEWDTLGFYFGNEQEIVLEDDEAKALGILFKRIGREINPDTRVFKRPDL